MGEFFTNVQVSRGKLGHALTRNDLAKRIVTELAAEGFRQVSTPGKGDRRIHVGGASEGGWLTVLDSATESQDPARLDQTAAMISTVAEAATVSIMVHDGDRLQLALFIGGSKRVSLDSWPGYFEGEPPSDSANGLDEWLDLLPAGRSVDDLRLAWRAERLDEGALPRLKRVARILGLDLDQCTMGAPSLPPSIELEFTALNFARDLPAGDRVASTLPALEYAGGIEATTRIRVEESRTLTMIAHSIAGPGSGLRAIVWGSAVEDGMVRIVGSSLTIGKPEENVAIDIKLDEQRASSGLALIATADSAGIPAGYASPGDAFAAAGGDVIDGMARWMATRLNFDVTVVGVKPGAGELNACLQPLANPDGQAVLTVHVRVDPST